MPNSDLKKIKGVEIFAAGNWNGDEYSIADIDEMVRAFDNTGSTFRPALKLGHDEKQTLLQRDGLPAAGWVGALYRRGEKLLADFIDIPEKVYELLRRGAYKRVSSEIFWNAKVGEERYSRLLGGVALLGSDLPGVTCLSDIFQMYNSDTGELKCYDLDLKRFTIEIDKVDLESKGDNQMEPKELEKLQADLDAETQKNHTLQSTVEEQAKEIEDLKKFKAETEAKNLELAKQALEASLDKEVTEMAAEKLITPAMKLYVRELIGEEKKEYSLKLSETEEKKFSKSGLLREILRLKAAKDATVNVDESSVDSKVENDTPNREQALQTKIEKYAKDHNVSYKVAYKTVMKEENVMTAEDEDHAE